MTDINALLRDDDKPVVLVVEDDVLVRLVLADFLRKCGFIVVEASTADEAINLLEEDVPADFVFAAQRAEPDKRNGFYLANWIRTNRPNINVIISAGVARKVSNAGELCENHGTTLPKPYNPAEVEQTIRRLLASRQARPTA